MPIIQARAVISATDKTGGVFEKIAGKFKSISDSASAMGKIKPIQSWGNRFQKDVDALKASGKEIDTVRKSWESFNTALQSGGKLKSSSMRAALGEWKTQTLSDLRLVRASVAETERAQSKLFKGAGRGVGLAAKIAGVGGAGYAAQRGVRATAKAGATTVRESARDYLSGLSDDESKVIKGEAMGISSRFNSLDAPTMHERLRDTAMSMRSVPKALEMGDTLARGQVVMQSMVGKDKAGEQSRKFFKGLDTLGKNQSPDEVRQLYDGYIKAQGVEGNDMDLGDLFTVAKMSKSAGATLDNRFLMATAPGLMQDMGSARLGTSLGSSMSQVIGGRATANSKEAQEKYGLRDKKGNFKNSNEIMSNPFDYAMNRLIPALEKKGVDVNDNVAVTKATSALFSNQLVGDLFNKMITQREQYKAKNDQYQKAPGLAAAEELPKRDPFVAAEGFLAQLRNMAASLSEPVFPLATSALTGLSGAMGRFAKQFSEDTGLVQAAKVGGGTAVASAAGALGVYGAKATYQWFTGAGKLTASATALDASAAALTAAAAKLAGGNLATTAANAAAPGAAAGGAAAGGIWSKVGTGLGAAASIPSVFAAGLAGGVLAGAAVVGAVKEANGTAGMPGGAAAAKASGGSRLDHIRASFNSDRERFGLAPTQAPATPLKAQVEGNATLTATMTIAPSAYFMTTIDQRIDNKINAFKSSNTTSSGTSGSTGRSAPDATPAP